MVQKAESTRVREPELFSWAFRAAYGTDPSTFRSGAESAARTGRPFGILQVDSRTPREFTDDDTVFLRSYANLLAAAVDRLSVIGSVRNGEARLRLALEGGMLGSWDFDVVSGDATRNRVTTRSSAVPGRCRPGATTPSLTMSWPKTASTLPTRSATR